MLEKPNLPDHLIRERVQAEYHLPVERLAFLPLGADANTAVYRLERANGQVFFLKLRKGDFNPITVELPHHLRAQGVRAVIAPLENQAGQLWSELAPYQMVLYPFITGRDGYELALTEVQWPLFGATLRAIHTTHLPEALARRIPREDYSPRWREMVRGFQAQVEQHTFDDPTAALMAAFMKTRRADINRLVQRGNELAEALQARQPALVLCHSDLHPGNLLLTSPGDSADEGAAPHGLYLVDWDNAVFAPKERDLLLIGGCSTWNNPRETALFYEGYHRAGAAPVDALALAYYRHERIIWDIAAFCEQILLSTAGGPDREQSLRFFTGQFLPGHEIDLAFQSDVV